jgi:hypothetical protein
MRPNPLTDYAQQRLFALMGLPKGAEKRTFHGVHARMSAYNLDNSPSALGRVFRKLPANWCFFGHPVESTAGTSSDPSSAQNACKITLFDTDSDLLYDPLSKRPMFRITAIRQSHYCREATWRP